MSVLRIVNPPVPLDWKWRNPQEHLRKVALVVNEILAGKTNNTLDITLTPDAIESEFEVARVVSTTVPILMPKTASAAAAFASLYVELTKGKMVVHHDSDPAEDRTFGVVLVG